MFRPTAIIIHNTGAEDTADFETQGIDTYHQSKGWGGVGYHIIVEKIKSQCWVLLCRPLNRPGIHCKNYNSTTIGFCFNGNFNKVAPSEQLLKYAAIYLKWLMDLYNIPKSKIFFHREMPGSNTDCPGIKFDKANLLKYL